MAVFVSPGGKDISIKVEEKDGQVHLTHNGHAFVRVFTDDKGTHRVVIVDVDSGTRGEAHSIGVLCWKR